MSYDWPCRAAMWLVRWSSNWDVEANTVNTIIAHIVWFLKTHHERPSALLSDYKLQMRLKLIKSSWTWILNTQYSGFVVKQLVWHVSANGLRRFTSRDELSIGDQSGKAWGQNTHAHAPKHCYHDNLTIHLRKPIQLTRLIVSPILGHSSTDEDEFILLAPLYFMNRTILYEKYCTTGKKQTCCLSYL